MDGTTLEQKTNTVSSPLLLVLLPGLDGTGDLFQWFVKALPSSLNPLVVSFPKDRDGDYAALEAHVVRLLPKDQPFVLLGESFSGPLALRIAAHGYPNLVAVILVASFVAKPVAWLPRFAARVLRPFIFRLSAQPILLRWFLLGKNPPPELIARTMECLRSVDPMVLVNGTKAALAVAPKEAFARCPVPILYLRGTQDRMIASRTARRLKMRRPGLECVNVAAPHFLLQRAPDQAARAIMEFVSPNGGAWRRFTIDIDFVAGLECSPLFPKATARFIERSGLKQRFAVIQSTYLETCPDAYFDEALWKRLVEFVVEHFPKSSISVIEEHKNPEEKGAWLGDYMTSWNQRAETERDRSPAFLLAKDDGNLQLFMTTEYWTDVGGPYPYHDSYTYSIFSNVDLSSAIRSYLQ